MTWASLAVRIGGLAVLLQVVQIRLPAPEVLVWQILSTIIVLETLADFGANAGFRYRFASRLSTRSLAVERWAFEARTALAPLLAISGITCGTFLQLGI